MTPVRELLNHIDPSRLAYQDWLAVGMALHHEGEPCGLWDEWSARDSRYRTGECARKWAGFHGSGTPVTAGTIADLARQQGWRGRELSALDWDSVIENPDELAPIVDTTWLEDAEVVAPADSEWNPTSEIVAYLSTLFSAEEYVGYVMESWRDDSGRCLPKKGSYSRTAGELIAELSRYGGDVSKVLGDYDPEAGAWIRFNPLDGQGVRDDNVTSFRYALIESDTLPIERQAAIYEKLELPVAALVHSGKKSLHAIVRVSATSREEYRERVNYLHAVCQRNGLEIDGANKNPSRLSRLPGIWRDGSKQYLVATNTGKASWEEWKAFVDEANDSLPDFENLADVFGDLPPLAPPLIDGILREGHKMLLAGPSKAGKSFMLLQLAIAIAEGRQWLGWTCAPGPVLYINLELDRASCLHRLKALYDAHGWAPRNVANIDLWNLRGKATAMDSLAPKLIRRALKKRYKAVIIDPLYKVGTGDENAADKITALFNQIDRVCVELKTAVVCCHHHSKGAQGQKSSKDRASGSGVFAREPDAVIDLIELIVTKSLRAQIVNRAVCDAVGSWLDSHHAGWRGFISQDDALVAEKLLAAAKEQYKPLPYSEVELDRVARNAADTAALISGWRMEGTLREFPPFEHQRFFFRHPIHVMDRDMLLADAKADGEEPPWSGSYRDKKKEQKISDADRIAIAYQSASDLGAEDVRIADLADELGVDERRAKSLISKAGGYVIGKDGIVRPAESARSAELAHAIAECRTADGRATVASVAARMACTTKTVRNRIAQDGTYEINNSEITEVAV